MSSSGRFEELRLDFVDTSAKYDGTYSTTICHREEDEQVLLRTAEYDIPCYVPFPSPPNRECAVLLRNWGTGEAPFETYKRLAAHAWRLLPFPLQQAVFHQADESFHVDGNSGRSCWTWLLWCDLLLRVDTVDSDTCQFDPFTRSARLMEEWGLNTDSSHPPDWLQVDLPDTGDGSGQPDDEVGDSGKSPVIKEPPKKAIKAYRLSILKGWSQEKIAVELGTNQGQVSRWLTAAKGYIEAGNVLPRLEFMAKPTTVDPNVLGMGARQDGLTPRQHDKRSDDSAD